MNYARFIASISAARKPSPIREMSKYNSHCEALNSEITILCLFSKTFNPGIP